MEWRVGYVRRQRVSGKAAKAIEFDASIYKVQTLVDGGLRVTLDLSEGAISQAAQLMVCKKNAVSVRALLTPIEANKISESIEKRRESLG